MIFKLKDNIKVIETEDSFILKTGNISRREVEIEKEAQNQLRELLINKVIKVDIPFDDLITLFELGFLDIINHEKNKLLVISDKNIHEVLSSEEIEIVLMNRDKFKIDQIVNKVKEKIEDKYPVIIFSSYDIDYIFALNTIFVKLDSSYRFVIYDGFNLFTGGVIPKLTGCFNCFVKKLLSGKDVSISQEKTKETTSEKILEVLIDSLEKDIELYNMDPLSGYVSYMNYRMFYSEKSINNRTVLCEVCCGRDNVIFKEQNIKSVNLNNENI